MDIQEMIHNHEEYKKKGLRLTEDDLFGWLMLSELMKDKQIELKSEYNESKAQLEVEEGIRKIGLKEEMIEIKDSKGNIKIKNKYTEDTADAVISQEYKEKRQLLSSLKLKCELLESKVAVIPDYINLVKLVLKK